MPTLMTNNEDDANVDDDVDDKVGDDGADDDDDDGADAMIRGHCRLSKL